MIETEAALHAHRAADIGANGESVTHCFYREVAEFSVILPPLEIFKSCISSVAE
jgi:hypothetical protein